MRIHRLVVEGIGPYADRQELDFDELTSHGLFLLTGPTGAGKTTVLDAVVFALYGTVPGARGADGKRERGARERLVSDLRHLDTRPEVELEFSAGGRRFVVRRSPDHDRPKTRGTGTTVAKASAGLEERINGDWVPRSTDFYEISKELQSVIGMNAAQFTQVVLLPQGEFAGFLRASVKDRREVLERLFQVDRYESAEQWFKVRADEAKISLATAQADLERVVERLSGALGDAAGPDEVRAELESPEAIAAWVSARRLEVDERVMTTQREADATAAASALAYEAYRDAVAITELTRALNERETVFAEHAARLPNARKWMASQEGDAVAADDAAWGERARAVRGTAHRLGERVADERRLPELHQRAAAADAAAETAARESATADAAVASALKAIEPLRAAAESGARAEATVDGLRRERAGLAERLQAAARRDALAVQAEAAHSRLAAARDAASAAQDALARQPSDEAVDEQQRALSDERQALADRRTTLEAEIAQVIREAERVTEARARHAALSTQVAELTEARDARRDDHLTARTAYLEAREARLDAMAAELAAGLEDGSACPVCGSTDHPSPAGGDDRGDLRAAEATAQKTAEIAEHALAAAQQTLDTCAGQLASIDSVALAEQTADLEARGAAGRTALAELPQAEQALAARAATMAAVVQARRAATRAATEAQAALAKAEHESAQIATELATATAQAGDGAAPSAQIAAIDDRLAVLIAQVEAGTSARDRIAALEREAEVARSASVAGRSAAAAQREGARGLRDEVKRIAAELEGLRGEHPTVEAAAEATSTHALHLEKAAELLADHQAALVERDGAAAALAQRIAVDHTLEGEPEDLVARTAFRSAARTTAGDVATEAASQLSLAKVQQKAVEEAETTLSSAIRALGPAAEAAERLIRLDLTIRGLGTDNVRKISLATYVLAARLEEVAAAATGHLLRMSSGRYELLHHDDRHGGGQAGLGLRVRDGWTGEERDTATLSGGEAFYASLSLALGLAEVVTNEAGGRPLDTLLVDEGFGSLDPDTLEEVLSELDQLRAAGRSIGLVSHVQALSERIPAQLRVEPGRTGSTASVVIGTASAA